MIEIDKIIAKTDEYLSHNKYEEAQRLLTYWEKELDNRNLLSIYNELLGLYRKTRQKEKAIETAVLTEALIAKLGLEESLSAATIYINIATVYSAFQDYAKALEFYRKAEKLYQNFNQVDNKLIASLYNNLGTCLTMLKKLQLSRAYLNLALAALNKEANTQLDRAITYLNLADLSLFGYNNEEEEAEYLNKAKALFLLPEVKHDGYYAFVSEKCAPGFITHREIEFGNYLKSEAKIIYERT